jgi:hypothetical protein
MQKEKLILHHNFNSPEFEGIRNQAGRSQNATLEINRGRHRKYVPTIDNKDIFHFRASLKDLGKKWFAFSRLEKDAFRLMERLKGK